MRLRRGRPPHPEPVTPAEARVLELVRAGLPNAEIAVRLGISVNTVKYHVARLMEKAGTSDRHALPAARDFPALRRSPPRWAIAAGLSLLAVVGAGAGLVVFDQPDASSKFEPIRGLVAVAGRADGTGYGIYAVDSARGPQLRVALEANVDGVAFSPDGEQFAYATEDPQPPCLPEGADCPGVVVRSGRPTPRPSPTSIRTTPASTSST